MSATRNKGLVRVRSVRTAPNNCVDVEVTVRVTNRGGLGRDEVDNLVNNVTASAMHAVVGAPYVTSSLSTLRVR